MTHRMLEANSIPIPPQLAGLLKQTLGRSGTGFDESAFLQQLHYWLVNPAVSGWVADGAKWVYNSLKSWQEQFPWMTQYGLRKAIANLKKLGLIQTAQHWITSYKRVMFYRIDYDRLSAFAGALCDVFASRCVNSDPVKVLNDRTTDTEIPSDNSLSEQQQTAFVVSPKNEEEAGSAKAGETAGGEEGSGIEVDSAIEATLSPASSGKTCEIRSAEFPELVELAEEVAEVIGHPPNAPLPTALKEVIEQFPDRVKPAIIYLRYQQQKRQIKNPVGYLYEAIVQGWKLTAESSEAIVPAGFSQWFDRARAQGLVIAATTINEIHHVLHSKEGWLPTTAIMCDLSTRI